VIQALVAAYLNGAKAKDKYLWLPLNYAAWNKAPVDVIQALVAAYPEEAKEKYSNFQWLLIICPSP